MAVGKRFRKTVKGARNKIGSAQPTGGKPSASPAWKPAKPAKSSISGPYGQMVSSAAHTRNAARKTAPSTKPNVRPTPEGGFGSSTPKSSGKPAVPANPFGEKPRRRSIVPSGISKTVANARKRLRY